MTSTWESDWQLAARERDDLVAERDALATQNTALIQQMGVSVENERQWGERVAKLEAALHEICGDSTEIGVIATAEIALELRAHSPPLLERTLQVGYDIQTRQRDEIRELRKALAKIADMDTPPYISAPGIARAALGLTAETACECMPLDVRGTPGDLEIFCPKCGKVFRKADTSKAETAANHDTSPDLAEVQSEWRGTDLWWRINGEWISDRDLRNWCANNMGDPGRHVDVVRRCHIQAYAMRER